MPVVHLIHGFLGVGKTTFAKRLEKETGAFRFSPDERMSRIHGDDPPAQHFSRFHAAIMAQLNEEWPRVLASGRDVILDYGFWTRAERDTARHIAQSLDAVVRLYAITCPETIARLRIRVRNTAPRGSLIITDATYDFLLPCFEPLQSDEPHLPVATAG